MRTGIRYVRYAPAVHAVFGADVGLHPVPRRALGIASVGRQNRNETRPAAYGQLLSALGAGALIGAAMLPKLKAIASIDGLITSAQRCLPDGHHRFGPPALLQGVLEREGERSAQIVGVAKTTRPGYSSMGGRVSPEELNLLDVFVPRM
jgi:Transmembrane secretion effector